MKHLKKINESELTDWENEYINTHLPEKLKSETFYYDNPSAAYEDIEFLLEVIKKLKN